MTTLVEIFSDGSCEGNPGRGGWAALLRSDGHERELSGSEAHTTNNRMELTAALKALESLPAGSRVHFFTDSEYLRKGITEWLPGWVARGWKRKGGALANVDLWQALAKVIRQHEIEWRWVRGHAGHAENERVDRLARSAMLRA
ncbi:MAG: ribonuclease HI [Anaerolineales bacterium]|nr:MAG: ribonuclease HI [Anaerolineales bacterium]